MGRTNKIRKAVADPLVKLEQSILTDVRTARNLYTIVDAPAMAGDERAGPRSRTLRRLTKIEKLAKAGVISTREAEACEWYAVAHAARYDTLGITARYGATGGGRKSYCHGPKTREQEDAYANFEFARAGISPMVLPMFERVVIHGRPLGRLAITFRYAARQLLERIEGKVALK